MNKPTLHCRTCDKPLSDSLHRKAARGVKTTGVCLTCWRDSIRKPARFCADCGVPVSSNSSARCHACANKLLAADEAREAQRIESIRAAASTPERQANYLRTNRLIGERKLAWCPPERRAEYFKLLKKHGSSAPARAEIEASMSPFEKKLAAVRQGAKVVRKIELRRPDHAFTLGGVSAGMVA